MPRSQHWWTIFMRTTAPSPSGKPASALRTTRLALIAALGSGEFHDHSVHGKAITGLGLHGFDDPIALGAQDVLHLHGLDDAQSVTHLDLLPGPHVDCLDQARH